MSEEKWNVTFVIYRQKTGSEVYHQSFAIEVDPDEYVLDGVERIWAFHDRSLIFRHACHHSTCGACAMRVNGVEKLTCITPIRAVTYNGGTLHIDPLRNFPVVSDLVVDMGAMYTRLEDAKFPQVAEVDEANLDYEKDPQDGGDYERLVDCIECGCCISACPIALTTPEYMGPAVLAGAHQSYVESGERGLLNFVDQENGLWRCHSAYECSAVCPSNVDPAWRIMNLRSRVIGNRIKKLFGGA